MSRRRFYATFLHKDKDRACPCSRPGYSPHPLHPASCSLTSWVLLGLHGADRAAAGLGLCRGGFLHFGSASRTLQGKRLGTHPQDELPRWAPAYGTALLPPHLALRHCSEVKHSQSHGNLHQALPSSQSMAVHGQFWRQTSLPSCASDQLCGSRGTASWKCPWLAGQRRKLVQTDTTMLAQALSLRAVRGFGVRC